MRAFRSLSFSFVLLLVTLFLIDATEIIAQDSETGSVRGAVLDPTGARVPQAAIVVVNAGTGARLSVASDAEGRFARNNCRRGTTRRESKQQGCLHKSRPNCTSTLAGASN
jgi:hypothetical protein